MVLIYSDIYSSKEIQKSFAYETLVPGPGQYNIFTVIDSTAHRHKSKMLSQAFSDRTMKEFEPTMLHHIDIFVKNLMSCCDETGSTWSIPINMTNRSGYLQYDVMGKFGFGSSFDMQTKSDNHFLMDAVEAICLRGGIFSQYPKLARLPIDKVMAFSKITEMRAKYSNLVTRLVKARVAAPKNSQPDIFKFLIDATNPETGKGFTEAELWAESRFLLIAGMFAPFTKMRQFIDHKIGADTSKTALSGIFYYLSAYPECYKKLVAEVRSTFKSAQEIRAGPKMASCRYLKACIDEMFRMSSPIVGTLWREVTAAGGIEVDGHHIPKGMDIGVNPYAIHHDESIHPNAGIYMPERWIASKDNPQESINRARHAFQPFSLGTRACSGRAFALMELSNTIVKTLWHMDFRRAEGSLGLVSNGVVGGPEGRDNPKEFQLGDHLTCAHEGPYLQFHLREGLEKNLVTIKES
jgi:cytochrome P450